MYVLIDKINKDVYLSESKNEIAKYSGVNYHSLSYYLRIKGFYENNKLIFTKCNVIKSKQGGKRVTHDL
jgi:hypothetical protein